MTDLAVWLEATAVAQHLKASRWTYPLVNAGHLFGLALLIGAVLPMDVALLRRRPALAARLRPWAMAGFALALGFGALLFVTQATDYIANDLFRLKMVLVTFLAANAALHLAATPTGRRRAAWVSLAGWPAVLILGRLVGYS